MAEVRYLDGQPAIVNKGLLTEARAQGEVWLWDCGPEEPLPPDEPEPPALSFADPKYHLENLRHKRAVKRFEEDLITYDRLEREYQNWHKNIRGPVEVSMWSPNARDALEHDMRAVKDGRQKKRRWYLSARTRGSERLKNYGLPAGIEPGPGHQENLERAIAGDKEFIAALKSDPHFGGTI
jgi:hypothetical protein